MENLAEIKVIELREFFQKSAQSTCQPSSTQATFNQNDILEIKFGSKHPTYSRGLLIILLVCF